MIKIICFHDFDEFKTHRPLSCPCRPPSSAAPQISGPERCWRCCYWPFRPSWLSPAHKTHTRWDTESVWAQEINIHLLLYYYSSTSSTPDKHNNIRSYTNKHYTSVIPRYSYEYLGVSSKYHWMWRLLFSTMLGYISYSTNIFTKKLNRQLDKNNKLCSSYKLIDAQEVKI